MGRKKMVEGVQVGISGPCVITRSVADAVVKRLGWVIESEECPGVYLATVREAEWNRSVRNGGWDKRIVASVDGNLKVFAVEIPQP